VGPLNQGFTVLGMIQSEYKAGLSHELRSSVHIHYDPSHQSHNTGDIILVKHGLNYKLEG
jgi:hypothetical protein